MFRGMFEGAPHVCIKGNSLAIFLISLDGAIAQPKRERRIRRLRESALRKASFRNDGAVTANDRVDVVLKLLACGPRIRVYGPHSDDQWIGAGIDRRSSTFV